MRSSRVMLAWLALFAAAAGTATGGPAPTVPPALPDRIEARIERVERGLLPTVSIRGRRDTAYTIADRIGRYGATCLSLAVIEDGRMAWARAYGSLDSAGVRVDTATLFQAGSISKAMTAFAALHLVDRGVLKLDEDVNLKLRSWKMPRGESTLAGAVTLRRLLSHSAGLNLPSYRGYRPGTPLPTLLQVLQGTPPANTPAVKREIAPGREWRYSGHGFSVVQQLITDTTRQPFGEVLKKTVFEPAGMWRTFTEQPPAPARAGSAPAGRSNGRFLAWRWNLHPEIAAAGLWSTASDLARFGIAVMHANRGVAGALLKPATGRELATRQAGSWGLGFALGGGAGDSVIVGHDGSTAGFVARLRFLPATGQGIAIMANGENDALLDEIERSVAAEYGWPLRPRAERVVAVVDPAAFEALAGMYRVEVDGRQFDFIVRPEGERLVIVGPSGRPAEVLPVAVDRFFIQDSGNEFTFTRQGGRVTAMQIDQQGQRFTARRMP
jgi:CubicO group peptidase (beta-lactamase class C family)